MRNMRILVDTNVLLDYVLDREPYAGEAARIFRLCENKTVQGCVAAHTIPLQTECAKEYRADYIVTRNCGDFSSSAVPALEPPDFLAFTHT